MAISVVYVVAVDWEGVYVNDVLSAERSILSSNDWKDALKSGWNTWSEIVLDENPEWLDREGSFPTSFKVFLEKMEEQ